MTPPGRWGDRRRLRIGVLGGSFNPGHAGHRHVAETALRRLNLDQVWLLVSPGNPLKPRRGMAPFPARLASAAAIARGPRLLPADLEARWGTRFTVDTLALLVRRFPCARFVLLLGADNLAQLPRWKRWRDLVRRMPCAVLPRPGQTRRALAGGRRMRWRGIGGGRRRCWRGAPPQGHAPWCLVPAREHPASATAIRAGAFRLGGVERGRAATPAGARGTGDAPIARMPKAPAGGDATPSPTPRAPRAVASPATPKPRARRAAPEATAVPPDPVTPRKRQVAAGPAAAPKPRKPRKTKATPDRLEELVAAARTSLEDDKAEDLLVLDVTGRADFTDRMIIATGQVERQLQAMAVHLEQALEKVGLKLRRSDIQASGDWVLIDAGDLVIHLFRPEARATYALERMWGPDSPAPER